MAEPLTVQLQGVLDRYLGGDAAAKAELVTMAEERLMVLARKLLRGFTARPDETAAVLGEAYLRLHKALDEVRPNTVRQFFGLASLQMRRVLLDLTRAAGRRGTAVSTDDPDGGFDPPAPGGERTYNELAADLEAALNRLDEDLREVVHLLFYQGLTQAEVGQLIGRHEDTVKRMWAKAQIILARYLDGFEPEG